VTIAVCLDVASKNEISIPEAMKAYELLRYNRTVATMKLGEEVRNRWHKTNVSVLPVDPAKLQLPHHPWLLDHDAAAYAEENFLKVVEDIRKGDGDKYKYSAEILRNPEINLETGEIKLGHGPRADAY
jgi:hypothetical protein